MTKWLFNPFTYVAGAKALLFGWVAMLLTASICVLNHTHFDGAIDVHCGRNTTTIIYFIEPLIDWACLAFFMYVGGRIFSPSAIRIVDVAGTTALARWPMIFSALIGFGIYPYVKSDHGALVGNNLRLAMGNADKADILAQLNGPVILLGLICVVFTIWMIALLYHAFSVSCNVKGGKGAGVFIAAIVAAEIVSKIIFYQLYHHI